MTLAAADERLATRELRPALHEWPASLAVLSDPPAMLRVRGEVGALGMPAVAIVGSRAATAYGLGIANRLSHDLARLGFVVVSGLARGIDAAAHQGALEAGGRTVAVLPGGLDHVSPPAHARLAAAIARQGALVSERPDAYAVHQRGEFIRRNRLIAALAQVTVVVEAAERSGALATAHIAERLGRPVLAVPGDIDREASRGTLALLRRGARPCADAADVLGALGMSVPPATSAAPPASAAQRLAAALEPTGRTIDALAAAAGIEVGAATAVLLELAWSGLASCEPGGRWRRGRS